jgi:hypothetical protein
MFLFVCLGTTSLQAQSFYDDFTNANPTSPDRDPVTWLQFSGDFPVIDNGSLLVGDGSGDIGSAFVEEEDFVAENLWIEARFNVEEGNLAGIFLRGDEIENRSYYAQIATSDHPDYPQTVGLWRKNPDGSPNLFVLLDSTVVDFSTDGEVVMRMVANQENLQVFLWPTDGAMPDQPLLATQQGGRVPAYGSGVIGAFANNEGGSEPSLASFQYFQAVVLGDVNFDGVTNLLDVPMFVDLLVAGDYQDEADINLDGEVNLLDVDPFVQLLSAG